MKKIQYDMFFLAFLVILSFVLTGAAIGSHNFLVALLLFLSGFVIMGAGLARKRKRQKEA